MVMNQIEHGTDMKLSHNPDLDAASAAEALQ